MDHVSHWNKTIFDVIPCDVVFITYPSDILSKLVGMLRPVHVQTQGYDCQVSNGRAVAEWMKQHRNEYDRFVVLRFDVLYRIRINRWPCWEKKGIILVGKDVHYYTTGCFQNFYQDALFVVDCDWVEFFYDAVHSSNPFALHHVGRDLEMTGAPLHVMFEECYRPTKNPIYVIRPLEDVPEIDTGYEGEPVPYL